VEILGLDPKITICKIAVLPVKLYPLYTLVIINPPGVRTQDIAVKVPCLNHLTSGSIPYKNGYPRNDLNVYDY
jgi:hypothetical protein